MILKKDIWIQKQTSAVKTHTPTTLIQNGDDKIYDSASSYNYDDHDEIFRSGHPLINAHSKDTTQLAKKQSSHASEYDADIETNTIAPKGSLARKKTDADGSHTNHDRGSNSTLTCKTKHYFRSNTPWYTKTSYQKYKSKRCYWNHDLNSIVIVEGDTVNEYALLYTQLRTPTPTATNTL